MDSLYLLYKSVNINSLIISYQRHAYLFTLLSLILAHCAAGENRQSVMNSCKHNEQVRQSAAGVVTKCLQKAANEMLD